MEKIDEILKYRFSPLYYSSSELLRGCKIVGNTRETQIQIHLFGETLLKKKKLFKIRSYKKNFQTVSKALNYSCPLALVKGVHACKIKIYFI